ncbi:hypothetical protein CO230_04055 [Chryseobacterium sp. 6424]|uniref:hypothetical protein n=1 Tax=Flavobacteriales TaxID=200644 RepID=UPI000EFB8BC5|nr:MULTISPECIES: hypothetical protein [Flavobacteriales]AYO57368.1 hypothetical protein CO230_04055 [Chryseobacterium sp. 6424]
MNYEELLVVKSKYEITYADLLALDEWKLKRMEILEKDQEKCTECGSSKSFGPFFSGSQKLWGRKINDESTLEETRKLLEIHHKYYIRNLLPWEYEDALTTLCSECHIKVHETEEIPIYFDSSLTQKITTETCERCGGTGFLKEYEYYQGGVCFGCQGTGMRIPWND